MRREEDAGSQVFEGVARVPGAEGMAGTAVGVKFEMRIGEHGVEV